VFINELFSFLFQSFFDVFRSVATKWAILSTQHSKQHRHSGRTHGDAHVGTSHRPALSASTAYCVSTDCLAGPAVIVEPAADVAVK